MPDLRDSQNFWSLLVQPLDSWVSLICDYMESFFIWITMYFWCYITFFGYSITLDTRERDLLGQFIFIKYFLGDPNS